jgi:hypothetical protein
MKTMLIITGPQGSGNHLFSKIFAAADNSYNWAGLNNTYWEPHDLEPFAKEWLTPELLKDFDWNQSDYFVTSISCPFLRNNVTLVPNYEKFITQLIELNIQVKVAIIGRDQTILEKQQLRLRKNVSLPKFIDVINSLMQYDPLFISQELLYLYKERYVYSIGNILKFPICSNVDKIKEILKEDANIKYITEPATNLWLDKHVKEQYIKKILNIK